MGDHRPGKQDSSGLGRVRDALNARLLRRDGHETYTLDADATLVGGEKRDAPWSDKGGRGYMPMLGFLFETPLCLVDEFREGKCRRGPGNSIATGSVGPGCRRASGWRGIGPTVRRIRPR